MKKPSLNYWIYAAVIAAVYAALTIVLSPISYGAVQVRVSEALCILPIFTPAAIPGLAIGCLISNIMSPYGIVDVIFGTVATFIGAYGTYVLRSSKRLAPLPPIIANGALIGFAMYYVYNVGMPLWACILWVSVGEFVACYALGYPLSLYLKKYDKIFKL